MGRSGGDWSGWGAVLADEDGDGITPAATNSTSERSKIAERLRALRRPAGSESLTEGDTCTLTSTDGFTNRWLSFDEDVVLDAVAPDSCFGCDSPTESS